MHIGWMNNNQKYVLVASTTIYVWEVFSCSRNVTVSRESKHAHAPILTLFNSLFTCFSSRVCASVDAVVCNVYASFSTNFFLSSCLLTGGFSSLFAALSFCIFKLIINKYVYFMQKCVHIIALRPFLWYCERQKCVYYMGAFYLFLLFFSGFIFHFYFCPFFSSQIPGSYNFIPSVFLLIKWIQS